MFLQRGAKQVSECESILVLCVDEEVGVNDASGRILDDCMRGGVVQTRPVGWSCADASSVRGHVPRRLRGGSLGRGLWRRRWIVLSRCRTRPRSICHCW
jgi:hypothetical protein